MMQSTSERDAAITRMISFGTTLLKLTLEVVRRLQPMAIGTADITKVCL
jgi:hypothetical protein